MKNKNLFSEDILPSDKFFKKWKIRKILMLIKTQYYELSTSHDSYNFILTFKPSSPQWLRGKGSYLIS